jgi:hypothetical protein
MPCIASRRGDLLELVFATVPAGELRTLKGLTRHWYRLEALSDTVALATLLVEEADAQ